MNININEVRYYLLMVFFIIIPFVMGIITMLECLLTIVTLVIIATLIVLNRILNKFKE